MVIFNPRYETLKEICKGFPKLCVLHNENKKIVPKSNFNNNLTFEDTFSHIQGFSFRNHRCSLFMTQKTC